MKKRSLFTVVELMNAGRREIKISILPAPGSASASDPVVALWRWQNEQVERRVIADSVSARRARSAADCHRRALEGTRWRLS